MEELIEFINRFPQGISAGEIERHFKLSRTTLNRRLKEALQAGTLVVTGKGPATLYHSADPLAALRAYFAKPHTDRTLAPYREVLLEPEPGLSAESVKRFESMSDYVLDKRELSKFLIDFSCASSVLEGGTYSLLYTQALIEYGERSTGKPLADAFLVLNHKKAFEYLHDHMQLDSIFTVHDLLTHDHDMPELKKTIHFLPRKQRGVTREYADVDIPFTAYLPPFRPGTGYIQAMLEKIITTADAIEHPVQARVGLDVILLTMGFGQQPVKM